ncbi:MAG TPA: DinB family protein [Candidatus Eisenbacteria bacterium]|nr:DinB family protein [Candidatus Eisenbacteria bacterium]
MNTVERFQRWYTYEKDSHAKVLASLDTVPQDRRTSPEFGKAVALLAHLVAARKLWLYRMEGSPELPKDIFFESPPLEWVRDALAGMEAAWSGYLSGLTDRDLDHVFEYRSLEGEPFRNEIVDVLTQLFGHSWYHRGQIAMLVRQLGGTPAVTDFVFWCREPITEDV